MASRVMRKVADVVADALHAELQVGAAARHEEFAIDGLDCARIAENAQLVLVLDARRRWMSVAAQLKSVGPKASHAPVARVREQDRAAVDGARAHVHLLGTEREARELPHDVSRIEVERQDVAVRLGVDQPFSAGRRDSAKHGAIVVAAISIWTRTGRARPR